MERKIAVVGLGYVGLPLAVAFGKRMSIVGFDIDAGRVDELRRGEDRTNEVDPEDIRRADVDFTSDPERLRDADYIVVAVPTPIDETNRPDLTALEQSSRTVGENLSAGPRTPSEAMKLWMDSPSHRDIILDPTWGEVGIAVRSGGKYSFYWVQEFGDPADY